MNVATVLFWVFIGIPVLVSLICGVFAVIGAALRVGSDDQ